ncbi:uncharacterized protein LOC133204871 [Saccostrea echinata]|uniref:uncharacterized protein LOC133204871 n=1 Tax=Saccostrea echinata TaxID=191078 RepID=UPI002A81A927|nr:uncharacterized protein LOC133204871 [Saccostrea echinata]
MHYHTLVPLFQEVVGSSTGQTELSEGRTDVTSGSSAGDDVPPSDGESSPAAETRPIPPSDEQKAVTDRVTDSKLSGTERLEDEEAEGDSSIDTSGLPLVSPTPSCTETQQTGVEDQSTRKRKRPDQPFVPSKRLKTALFSPMEMEIQCLVQMFGTMSL